MGALFERDVWRLVGIVLGDGGRWWVGAGLEGADCWSVSSSFAEEGQRVSYFDRLVMARMKQMKLVMMKRMSTCKQERSRRT